MRAVAETAVAGPNGRLRTAKVGDRIGDTSGCAWRNSRVTVSSSDDERIGAQRRQSRLGDGRRIGSK